MSSEIQRDDAWLRLRAPARFGRAACETCGRDFQPKTKTHVRCSTRCARAAAKAKSEPRTFDHLPTTTVGAMAEALACYDLMAQGYEVFRAMSLAASCDLIAMKDGSVLRVQVRTGYRSPLTGVLTYSWKASDDGRQDVYAIVVHKTRDVTYLDGARAAIELA